MDIKAEIPNWLKDIVYRLKQSHLTISVDEVGQLQLSDSLKGLLLEIIALSQKNESLLLAPPLLPDILKFGPKEIEEITTAIEVVIGARDRKITTQYVTHQFNFFPPTPPSAPQNTFTDTFGLPRVFRQFTGREAELLQLRNNLGKAQVITQKISGTGGVGKSQLANYFAHQMLQEKRYQWVIWISGGLDEKVAESAVRSQLSLLGMELGFDVQQLQEKALYRAIYQRLFEKGKGLIVFDDMPNYDVIALYLPENYGQFKADVLITTRNSNYFGPEMTVIALDIFTLEDAKQYIQKILKERISATEAERLAFTLGCYPLALSQAIAYIANNRECAVDQYCEHYRGLVEARKDYLARRVIGDPYEQERRERERPYEATMIAVVQMSLQQIEAMCESQEKYERTKMLLLATAYVAPEAAIPKGVLKGWLPEDEAELQLTALLEILRGFSLLEEAKKGVGYQIHQVVQEVLKLGESQETSLSKLLRWKKVIRDYLKSDLSSLVSKNEKKHLELKAHAIVLAEQLSREAHTEDILQAQGDLYGVIEYACEIQGEIKEGKNYCEYAESCHRRRPVSPSQSEDVAWALMRLGGAMVACGDPQGAKEKLQEAVTIMKAAKGEEHESVGKCLVGLGGAMLKCEDPVGAKEKLVAALFILKTTLNEKHAIIGSCLSSLGGALSISRDFQGAKEKFEEALPILQAAYGEGHAYVAYCLTNLGATIMKCGDPREAKEKLESALPILKTKYGESHPNIAQCLLNLGTATRECGDLPKAQERYEAALVILKATFGEEHTEVARCLSGLGRTILLGRDALTAQGILKKALDIFTKAYGAHHNVTQSCREAYEVACKVVSHLTDQVLRTAKPCFEIGLIVETMAVLEKIFQQGLCSEGLMLKARCLLLRGDYNAAYKTASNCQNLPDGNNTEVEKLLEDIKRDQQQAKLWEIQVNAIRSRGKLTISDQINLVMNLHHLKRFDEALNIIENLISQNPPPVLLASIFFYQAQCYFSLQRFKDASVSINNSLQLKENPRGMEFKRKIELAIDLSSRIIPLPDRVSSSAGAALK